MIKNLGESQGKLVIGKYANEDSVVDLDWLINEEGKGKQISEK